MGPQFRTRYPSCTSCFSRKSPMFSTNKYGKCFDICGRLWHEKEHFGVWSRDVAPQTKFPFQAVLQQACLTTLKRWMGVNDIKLIIQEMYVLCLHSIYRGWLTNFCCVFSDCGLYSRKLRLTDRSVLKQNDLCIGQLNEKVFWSILNSKYSMSFFFGRVYWWDIFPGTVHFKSWTVQCLWTDMTWYREWPEVSCRIRNDWRLI